MSDPELVQRFNHLRSELEEVIERILPGDFPNWEEANTTWDGDIKTVDFSGGDPRPTSCALGIFRASEEPDMCLGFRDREAQFEALDNFVAALEAAKTALEELDDCVRRELSRAATARYRKSISPQPKKLFPIDYTFLLHAQALPIGVEAARAYLDEFGDEKNRANRRAAAVVEACREVYELRTGMTAPTSARDQPQKKEADAKPALFVQLASEIFQVLGINSTIGGALDCLRSFRN